MSAPHLSLDEMVAHCHDHARNMLIGKANAQLMPFFHVQFKDRPPAIMAAPWRDDREKSAFISGLRFALKAFGPSVVNYAGLSEAWVASEHKDHPTGLMPSEREDKKEVVVVTAGDHKSARMLAWEIIRDAKGRVTDLVEDKDMKNCFGGRMFDLLNAERS
jgi:hypothetical protein